MNTCDYKNCEKKAIVKGFVSLREPDPITGSKFLDVNACDEHQKVNGFFEYFVDAGYEHE